MANVPSNDRGALGSEVADILVQEEIYSAAWDQANREIGSTERADLSAADDPANVKDEPVVPVVPAAVELPVTETTPSPDLALQQLSESDKLSEEEKQRYEAFKDTLKGIHRKDKETWETERVALLVQLEEAKLAMLKPETPEVVPSTKTETAATEVFVDSLTDEQKEQLKEYEQDFDVVSKMEGIKRGQELGKLRKEIADWKAEIISQFTGQLTEQQVQFTSQIAPAIALAEDSDRESHFDVIRTGYELEDGTLIPGHNDFEKYRDDGSLLAWIESKPKYLQPALRETYSKGAAMDVIDLITDFKREQNIPLTPHLQPLLDNVAPINPTKTARKQVLTAVTTRRGAVNIGGGALANDYESAWDEANAKQGG